MIEEIDPSAAPEVELTRCHEAWREQHDEMDADEPFVPREVWLSQARARHPWSRPLWLVDRDPEHGAVQAIGVLGRTSDAVSRHVAKVRIDVLPARRREGIGTGLLRRLLVAADEDGRTLLSATVDERSAAVEVLPRWGFEVKSSAGSPGSWPEVARVEAWNACSNRHMVAINQAMAFDVIRWTSTWQAPTAAVVAAVTPRRRTRDVSRYTRFQPPRP